MEPDAAVCRVLCTCMQREDVTLGLKKRCNETTTYTFFYSEICIYY